MEVLEGEEDVGSVEPGILWFESLALTNVKVELASLAIIKHEVESFCVLERILEPHDEWMLHPFEDAPLTDGVRNLSVLSDVLLL